MGALLIKASKRLLPSSLSREPSGGREKSVCLRDFLMCSDFTDFIDEFGIRRRKKGNAAKYKNRVFQCPLCKRGHSNKASEKVEKHKEDCPALWIFKKWEPWPLEELKFVKS